MNLIRTLFDSGSNEELMSLSSGEFLLLRSFKSPKSSVEYIFSDAMICVKRCGQYEYLLCVERQDIESEDISDGDSEDILPDEMSLLSATSKKDDTWSFRIEKGLQLVKSWNAERRPVIIWNNTRGDDGDQFEYIIEDTIPLSEIDKFYKLIKLCTYEVEYRKPSEQATRDELLLFMKPEELDVSDSYSFAFDDSKLIHSHIGIPTDRDSTLHSESSKDTSLSVGRFAELRGSKHSLLGDTYRSYIRPDSIGRETEDGSDYFEGYDNDDNNGDILQYANSLKKYKYGEADENGYESYDDDEDDEEDAEGIFVDAKEYITD
ncbi:vacuolar import and degradation protein 27 [Kluyveromyces marxianus]|nr:vacuolar import and degradation protein 27 [Kluyveromyces marxianus]